jgi:hypothetical protein
MPGLTVISSNPDAQSGYTSTPSVDASWTLPIFSCPNGGCHVEYCLSQTPPNPAPPQGNGLLPGCSWQNTQPTTYTLGGGNGTNTVYGEYRIVVSINSADPSYPASASIILNQVGPSASPNSPAGLATATLQQIQYLNATAAQWVTFSASSAAEPTETVGAYVYGCPETATQNSQCTELTLSELATPPYMWEWPAASYAANYTYIQLEAEDQAGNTFFTGVPRPATVLTLFNPSTAPGSLTCGPSDCITLADWTEGSDIPNDSPSGIVGNNAFTGYSEPSMRGDYLIAATNDNGPANPWGTNLYMLYGYPLLNSSTLHNNQVYSGAVEVHLAYSSTTGGAEGGLNWTAWCEPQSTCSTVTPIYPSASFGSGETEYFSSHEVAKFWPYIDTSTNTETWYAAHLMYYVQPSVNFSLPASIITSGCLVISSAQGTPGNLAWTGSQPASCSDTPPTGSVILTYQDLDQYAGLPLTGHCYSWGQPTIMVGTVPTGSLAAYLATECFNQYFQTNAYYIFTTSDLTFQSAWTVFEGPFSYSNLPSGSYPGSTNSITEFDWVERPDHTFMGVVTPEEAGGAVPMQYGCLALNLNLSYGLTSPFGSSIIATITDEDGDTGIYEEYGPNGCTYEPTSNTGIVIVRHLINSGIANPVQYQEYGLVNTGIMP